MIEERKCARSKAEFIGLADIGPELVEVVTDFIERPAVFFSLPFERRREIEYQMDTILSSQRFTAKASTALIQVVFQ
jgi:hypothetical protein